MADSITAVVHTRAIEDIDAMAASIADGLEAEYVQLEALPFSARATVVSLPEMVVQFVHEDVAIVRRLRIPAGRWAFVVPLTVPDSARWNACAVNGDEVVVCAPQAECYAFDPRGTIFAIISVPETRQAAVLGHDLLEPGALSRTVLPRARDARELQHRLNALIASARRTEAMVSAAAAREIGAALELCLRSAVPADRHIEASTGRSQNRPARRGVFPTAPGRTGVDRAAVVDCRRQRTQPAQRVLRRLHHQSEALSAPVAAAPGAARAAHERRAGLVGDRRGDAPRLLRAGKVCRRVPRRSSVRRRRRRCTARAVGTRRGCSARPDATGSR